MMRTLTLALALWCAALSPAQANRGALDLVSSVKELAAQAAAAMANPPEGFQIEVGFSPKAGAEDLVLKVINTAKKSIRLQAYSFTSARVVQALVAAKKRGVEVYVVVDHRGNVGTEARKNRSALNTLVNAGVSVRTNGKYAIHHDKVIIVDELHVETGSYNYSDAAATRNSENVIVIWNHPTLAQAYIKHWQSRYDEAEEFTGSY